MIFLTVATILIVSFFALSKTKVLKVAGNAPVLAILMGAGLSYLYRAAEAPMASSEWTAAGADAMLAALAFAAASQFRVSRLASVCPASFRLTFGGAPLFLIICGLAAFILVPHLSLTAALLVAAALTLNGAAFDRRAVSDAPAPAIIKAAVRLESAAVLALGLPVAVLIEAAATTAPLSAPAVTPLYHAGLDLFVAFGLGGSFGLIAALIGNRQRDSRRRIAFAGAAAALAAFLAAAFGAHPAIAAAAAGLLWGEQTNALITTRVRLRRVVESMVVPAAFLAFGALLAPRLFQADLLTILFALIVVTVMRAGPRLVALAPTRLPKESQMFLAWFGGAPGAASALFLISLFDAPMIATQDAVLTVGALAVAFGVLAARLTSRPLLNVLLKETALARRRSLYAG